MQYISVHVKCNFSESFMQDVLVSEMGDLGFESFVDEADGFVAYIQETAWDEEAFKTLIQDFPFAGIISYEAAKCEDKDWNAEWEKNFQPVLIADKCVICPTWQLDALPESYKSLMTILINPKMAFGTGQHQTTSLILETLLSMDLKGKKVLDMGCGTAILAIMASKLGAKQLTAIDIDDWCTENAKENIALNEIENIEVMLGDARLLCGMHFDLVIANINRNILLMDMDKYVACLSKGGELIMSGFYAEDVPILEARAKDLKLQLMSQKSKDRWTVIRLSKLS